MFDPHGCSTRFVTNKPPSFYRIEFADVVVTAQLNFVAVVPRQSAKFAQTSPTPFVVVRALLRNGRDGMVVLRQLGPEIIGIADMEQPAVLLADCHAAMPERVAEQRNQQHFGREVQIHRSGFKPKPSTLRCPIRLPVRLVFKLARNIPPMS